MWIVRAALLLAISASPALAQRAPVIVIPGRPDVPVLLKDVLPVFMNGVDASWAVIEGEFGLDRPGEVTPTVVYRPIVAPFFYPGYRQPGYFPTTGRRPGYGRLEVAPPPNRQLPSPAPPYYHEWSSESTRGPATDYPPYVAPELWVAPQSRPNRASPPSGQTQNPVRP